MSNKKNDKRRGIMTKIILVLLVIAMVVPLLATLISII